jgi:hypothetical protein
VDLQEVTIEERKLSWRAQEGSYLKDPLLGIKVEILAKRGT